MDSFLTYVPIISVAILAGLFVMALTNFSTIRKNIRMQSEQQIYSSIMDARLKLESTETFTKMAKESPIFAERFTVVDNPDEYYVIVAFLDLFELLKDSFDAFVFVTAEYNHGIPAALKNAIDFLFKEWNNKVAGFVGYGSAGGVRSVEQLRLVMAELQVATVRVQVQLSLFTDFENFSVFKPAPYQETSVNTMLDQVISWGNVLKTLRT